MYRFSKEPLIVILGCTCTGKTKFSVHVSNYLKEKDFELEIIGADARQIYKDISIGTAKPTFLERSKIRHHMIDFLNPQENYNASLYAKNCLDVLSDIYKRNVLPVLVGGSGLYIQSLVEGIFDGPSSDESIRDKLTIEYEDQGSEFMHKKLEDIDPESASRIHPNDKRRLIRALEVYEISGESLSTFQNKEQIPRFSNPLYIGLSLPKEELNSKIEKRVRNMLSSGMVEESELLVEQSLQKSLIFEGLGFSEAFMLGKKEIGFETAVEKISILHRQYAKRHRTLFDKNPLINWYDISAYDENALIQELSSLIIKYIDKNEN